MTLTPVFHFIFGMFLLLIGGLLFGISVVDLRTGVSDVKPAWPDWRESVRRDQHPIRFWGNVLGNFVASAVLLAFAAYLLISLLIA